MSIMQAPPERMGASPLMSNNPFRNKIAISQPQVQQQQRPVSTNPFLDSHELQRELSNTTTRAPADGINDATKLFASMNMNGKPQSPERRPRPTPNGSFGRPENMPPRPMRGLPPNHRPSPSDEDRRRQASRRGTDMDIFADPPRRPGSRERKSMRRNSESSVRDKPSLLDSEEERKRRDRKSRDPRSGKHRPSRRMDIIDKLDVTSIYGTGLFHHDGPFDACNPNRNKRRHRLAPIQAFPKDSANMQIGGNVPLKMDYDRYHGRTQEAHIDYNEAALVDEDADYTRRPQVERSTSFNPTATDTIHGSETAGLGTSTFLEGAPASRLAIQRRDSEMNEFQQQPSAGSLSRKKSLAQKIRGVRGGSNRVQSPIQSPDLDRAPASPLATSRSENINNPFFKDYDREYEKKGQQIAQAEELGESGRARALSSPKLIPTIERTVSGEIVDSPQENKPSGFLGRMKSLKKSKRPERRDAS